MNRLEFTYIGPQTAVPTLKDPSKPVRTVRRYRTPAQLRYSADLPKWRRLAAQEMKKALDAVTGDPWTAMNYVFEPRSGLPKVVFRSGVYPKNWRRHAIEFQAPGRFSNRHTLETLVSGLRTGLIRFEPVDPAEVALIVDYFGIDWAEACAARNHSLEVRDLRPLATRSGLLRKGTTNKTAQEVDDPEDAVDDSVWPDDVMRAMYKMMDVPLPPTAVKPVKARVAHARIDEVEEPAARVVDEVADEIEEWE